MRCEDYLQRLFNIEKVLLTHSCTAALEMSAILLDLEPGDEIILPSYTFCSTATAFLRSGAKLVFCEIDPQTMMVDVDDIAKRITDRTKVIVPIHYAGNCCDLDGVVALAKDARLEVVEDAAQGVNGFKDGRALGSFGRFGCVSFHETKNLHAGLCGALYLNNTEDVERATFIWERGTNRQQKLNGLVDKYTWIELGSSFYPTEFQAAFLLAQLENIAQNQQERMALYEAYMKGLQPLIEAGILNLPKAHMQLTGNAHAVAVIFNSAEACDGARTHLNAKDIHAYIGYVPLHSSPMGARLGYCPEDLPITEMMARRLLRLPLHNSMTLEEVELVCFHIQQYFK